MTNIDEILNALRTPVDFTPLIEKADAIKAKLDAIGEELDKLTDSLS